MKQAVAYTLWFRASDATAPTQTKLVLIQAVTDTEAERFGRQLAAENGLVFLRYDRVKEVNDNDQKSD